MLENLNIIDRYQQEGYVIIPQLFARERVSELRLICDRILDQWFERFPRYKQRPRKKNCSPLTDLYYFKSDREQLIFLLNTIGDPSVLSILKSICNCKLLFHDLQYFFNPLHTTWRGYWHRDGQAIAPDDATEQRRLFDVSDNFIRVNIALIPDDNLEIVPGSHTRWDTKEELEIRKELNGKNNTSEMPSLTKIVLNPGDAVFFDGFTIHRGNYFVDKPRRTIAMLYSSPVDYHTPPPTCFLESNILDYLSPEAKLFFQDFINGYKSRWLSEV
jgi:ectoine hydroxylase-related dioxygenase (phytanoyl-CoA dioxygenase family)